MSRALLALVLPLMIACSTADDPDAGADPRDAATPDASSDGGSAADAGSTPDAGSTSDGGSVEEDAGPEPDAGPPRPGSVAWSSELENPYEHTLTDGIALDYFLQYAVELPIPGQPPMMVRVEICQQPAEATAPSCTNIDRVAADGTSGIRFGLDPVNYDEGLNLYTFTVRLFGGSTLIAEDTLEWRITYAPGA